MNIFSNYDLKHGISAEHLLRTLRLRMWDIGSDDTSVYERQIEDYVESLHRLVRAQVSKARGQREDKSAMSASYGW